MVMRGAGTRTMRMNKQREDVSVEHRDDDQGDHAQNYAFMLHNLIVSIQEYLLLSDDDKQHGALTSLVLVDSTAQLRDDNRICVWLADVSGLVVG